MKTCFKCKKEKRLSEFYKHPMMGDGHLGKCKECTRLDVRGRYRKLWKKNPEWTAFERERCRIKAARYRNPELKNSVKKKTETYQGTYGRSPEKRNAENKLTAAIGRGDILRPSHCSKCGAGGKIHGHHQDYSKPLAVMWLCLKCHHIAHRKWLPVKFD